MGYCDKMEWKENNYHYLQDLNPTFHLHDFNLTRHKRSLIFHIIVQKIGIYNVLAC